MILQSQSYTLEGRKGASQVEVLGITYPQDTPSICSLQDIVKIREEVGRLSHATCFDSIINKPPKYNVQQPTLSFIKFHSKTFYRRSKRIQRNRHRELLKTDSKKQIGTLQIFLKILYRRRVGPYRLLSAQMYVM